MIKSFASKDTEAVFRGEFVKKLPRDMQTAAYTKLLMLDSIKDIKELQLRPALNCEKLKGRLAHLWSIRINKQWRVCFEWNEKTEEATSVQIADYH